MGASAFRKISAQTLVELCCAVLAATPILASASGVSVYFAPALHLRDSNFGVGFDVHNDFTYPDPGYITLPQSFYNDGFGPITTQWGTYGFVNGSTNNGVFHEDVSLATPSYDPTVPTHVASGSIDENIVDTINVFGPAGGRADLEFDLETFGSVSSSDAFGYRDSFELYVNNQVMSSASVSLDGSRTASVTVSVPSGSSISFQTRLLAGGTLLNNSAELNISESAFIRIKSLTDGYSYTADSGLGYSPIPGDNNVDGKIDLGNDFNLFLQGFLGNQTGWIYGDYNDDGVVDTKDFQLFIDGYVSQGGTVSTLTGLIETSPGFTASQRANLLSVIPEPSSLTVVLASAYFGIRRKRATSGAGAIQRWAIQRWGHSKVTSWGHSKVTS